MQSLDETIKAARALGLSYGEYVARYLSTEPHEEPPAARSGNKTRKRRYTDAQAFALWQDGKSDSEIGKALGVSRQIIQRWRDTMELPSTMVQEVDTSRYRLIKTADGAFAVIEDATQEARRTV